MNNSFASSPCLLWGFLPKAQSILPCRILPVRLLHTLWLLKHTVTGLLLSEKPLLSAQGLSPGYPSQSPPGKGSSQRIMQRRLESCHGSTGLGLEPLTMDLNLEVASSSDPERTASPDEAGAASEPPVRPQPLQFGSFGAPRKSHQDAWGRRCTCVGPLRTPSITRLLHFGSVFCPRQPLPGVISRCLRFLFSPPKFSLL